MKKDITSEMIRRNENKPTLKPNILKVMIWYPTYLVMCFGAGAAYGVQRKAGKISIDEHIVKVADFAYEMYKIMCC